MQRSHFDNCANCTLSCEGSALKACCWTLRNNCLGEHVLQNSGPYVTQMIPFLSWRYIVILVLRSNSMDRSTPRKAHKKKNNFMYLDLFFLSLKVSFTLNTIVQLCPGVAYPFQHLPWSSSCQKFSGYSNAHCKVKTIYKNIHPRYLVACPPQKWALNVMWLINVFVNCTPNMFGTMSND